MFSPASAQAADASVCDFTVEQYGKRVPMSKFRGEVLVIVNVASE
jgi:glutathione peroxidase-family protein